MNKVKITGIIPTYNNEKIIEKAIKSLDFCDELIIVDSYSTDSTLEIAKKYTDKIYQREYENSASQKNWIIPKASNEWIFLLDSDEEVSDGLKKEIVDEFNKGLNHDAYWVKRENSFMGSRLRFSGIRGDKVVRLFKKSAKYQTKHVHAEIITDGLNVKFFKNKIRHNTFVTIKFHVDKLNRYAVWQSNDYEEITGKVGYWHLFWKPLYRFFKHFVFGLGFLDGIPGFVYAIFQAYAVGMRYVMIWLKRRGLQ